MSFSLNSYLHFRTFRGRLAFFFLSLIGFVLAASFLIVLQANRRHASSQIEENLHAGSRIFATLTERRLDELAEQARLLAYDYGFKQAFSSSADDPATIRLAMQNWRDRIKASFIAGPWWLRPAVPRFRKWDQADSATG